MKAGQHNPGHRYGCWGTKRGGEKTAVLPICVVYMPYQVTDRVQIVAPVTTPWNDIQCGHDNRHNDMACEGCMNTNRSDE